MSTGMSMAHVAALHGTNPAVDTVRQVCSDDTYEWSGHARTKVTRMRWRLARDALHRGRQDGPHRYAPRHARPLGLGRDPGLAPQRAGRLDARRQGAQRAYAVATHRPVRAPVGRRAAPTQALEPDESHQSRDLRWAPSTT